MTTNAPSTTRLLLGFASGGLNCLLAFGFIVVAATSDRHPAPSRANACAPAHTAQQPCTDQPGLAAAPTPAASDLRELAVAR